MCGGIQAPYLRFHPHAASVVPLLARVALQHELAALKDAAAEAEQRLDRLVGIIALDLLALSAAAPGGHRLAPLALHSESTQVGEEGRERRQCDVS